MQYSLSQILSSGWIPHGKNSTGVAIICSLHAECWEQIQLIMRSLGFRVKSRSVLKFALSIAKHSNGFTAASKLNVAPSQESATFVSRLIGALSICRHLWIRGG